MPTGSGSGRGIMSEICYYPDEVEIWKDIPEYIGYYQASTHGRIRSVSRKINRADGYTQRFKPRIMAQNKRDKRRGYLSTTLSKNGKQFYPFVHTLVLNTFVGLAFRGMECRHIDNNAANNHISNLKWGTHLENEADKDRHKTRPYGEKNGKSVLTRQKAKEIKYILSLGLFSCKKVGEFYGVSKGAIENIKYRRTWVDV